MLDQHRNPDGTYNGVGVMADLTGLSRKTIQEIAEEAKANQARLASCPYHDFSPILPRRTLGQKYRCIECGGEVDAHAYHWFQEGRRQK